jgi:hypothetical protein
VSQVRDAENSAEIFSNIRNPVKPVFGNQFHVTTESPHAVRPAY